MKKTVALLLGLAAFSFVGGGTAAAQIYYYGPGGYYGQRYYGQRYYVPGMAPWRIARIVRAAGLTPLSAPARRGPTYEVVAVDAEGRHVRVMVDAYQGAITSVRPVAALRQNGEPYAPPSPRVAAVPAPEEAEAALSPRSAPIAPTPYGVARPPQALPQQSLPPQSLPPQTLPPQTLPPQTLPPQALPSQATQSPPSPPPSNQRLVNAPATTGSTAPTEIQRTPIPRPRPNTAATAAVAPSQAPVATPPAATTAPADVPEAPPAPTRRPNASAAAPAAASPAPAPAAAAASAKATTSPAPTAAPQAATPQASRPVTTMVPVAPLD